MELWRSDRTIQGIGPRPTNRPAMQFIPVCGWGPWESDLGEFSLNIFYFELSKLYTYYKNMTSESGPGGSLVFMAEVSHCSWYVQNAKTETCSNISILTDNYNAQTISQRT
jgi:hypothetical protein